MIEDPTHLIRRNFVQFSKYYLRLVQPDGFYILSNPQALVKNFFEFVFRHPLELFISCLTTFKYVTSFFSLLQVLFSFY